MPSLSNRTDWTIFPMGTDSNRRGRTGITNSTVVFSATTGERRPKTERSRFESTWLNRRAQISENVKTTSLSPLSPSDRLAPFIQGPAPDEATDSMEFIGLGDEEDPDPEILEQFLRSGTDPSCPMSVQVCRVFKK